MTVHIFAAILLVGLAVAGLCVGIIFRKDHSFRSYDVGASADMRKRGIYCTKTQDAMAQRKSKSKK